MIIVKIIGGLGNQMFQYALGRHLAFRNNTTFKLDISDFKNYEFHKYSLDHLNIQEVYASDKEVKYFNKYKKKSGKIWYLRNTLCADHKKYAQERQYAFTPAILELKEPCYLDGYWQSEKYFKDIENIIRNEFTIKTVLSDYTKGIAQQISICKNPVSLHIRRGDFANHPTVSKYHGVCPPEYYEAAINNIITNIRNPSFFIFSDDITWAKNNIKIPYPTVFVEQGPDKNYEDLELMRLCEHHILSNSTFGWWGAWLSYPGEGKITIAPMKWLNKELNIKDLIPEGWLILPF